MKQVLSVSECFKKSVLCFSLVLCAFAAPSLSSAAVSGKFRSSPYFLSYKDFKNLSSQKRGEYLVKLRWYFSRLETRIGPDRTGVASFMSLVLDEAQAVDDQGNYCVVSGFLSKRGPSPRQCLIRNAVPSEVQLGIANKCTGSFPCNPLLFGYENVASDKPYCVNKGPTMTAECTARTKDQPATAVADAILAKGHGELYDAYMAEMSKQCEKKPAPLECEVMKSYRYALVPAYIQAKQTKTLITTQLAIKSLNVVPDTSACTGGNKAWKPLCSARSNELSCSSKSYDLDRWKKDDDSVFDGFGHVKFAVVHASEAPGITPVLKSDSIVRDWTDDINNGKTPERTDIKTHAEALFKACAKKPKGRTHVIRLKNADPGSYTYACGDEHGKVDLPKDANADDEQGKDISGQLKNVDHFPFIRIYQAGGSDPAFMEYSSGIEKSDMAETDAGDSKIVRAGDADPFATRASVAGKGTLANPDIRSDKDVKNLKKERKNACKKSEKYANKHNERDAALDTACDDAENEFADRVFEFDVKPGTQCAKYESPRPNNWIFSSIAADGKTMSYQNCDSNSDSSGWKVSASTKTIEASKDNPGKLEMTELDRYQEPQTFLVDPKDGTCDFTVLDKSSAKVTSEKIAVTKITPRFGGPEPQPSASEVEAGQRESEVTH